MQRQMLALRDPNVRFGSKADMRTSVYALQVGPLRTASRARPIVIEDAHQLGDEINWA